MALHEAKPAVIHRDIKPRNILVFSNPDDRSSPILKVADFGLSAIAGASSRLTTSGHIIGTGFYMAVKYDKTPVSEASKPTSTRWESRSLRPPLGMRSSAKT